MRTILKVIIIPILCVMGLSAVVGISATGMWISHKLQSPAGAKSQAITQRDKVPTGLSVTMVRWLTERPKSFQTGRISLLPVGAAGWGKNVAARRMRKVDDRAPLVGLTSAKSLTVR